MSYNWEEIFKKGNVTDMVKGVDFTCSPKSLMQQVRNRAQALGMQVEIHCTETSVCVICYGKKK